MGKYVAEIILGISMLVVIVIMYVAIVIVYVVITHNEESKFICLEQHGTSLYRLVNETTFCYVDGKWVKVKK